MPLEDSIFTKILNNKIMEKMNTKLPEEQYGFRSNRNCQKGILQLTNDLAHALTQSKGAICAVFIDFEKALDNIDRKTLINTLNDISVKGKILKCISNIISSNSLTIDNGVEQGKTTVIQRKGVIQGDPLSSTLFLLYIVRNMIGR